MPDSQRIPESQLTKSRIFEVAIRVGFPLLLGISAWTFAQLLEHDGRLWAHEVRMTLLEERSSAIRENMREIGLDVKKLLEGGR